jgi:hypothetical protein
VIEDGLDFEHNVADAEVIGSPQVRLRHDRKIRLLVRSPLDRVLHREPCGGVRAFRRGGPLGS